MCLRPKLYPYGRFEVETRTLQAVSVRLYCMRLFFCHRRSNYVGGFVAYYFRRSLLLSLWAMPWNHYQWNRRLLSFFMYLIVAEIPKSPLLCGFSGFFCSGAFFLKRYGQGRKWKIWGIIRIKCGCGIVLQIICRSRQASAAWPHLYAAKVDL